MDILSQLLQSGKPILLDGAMGTMLMAAGLEAGDAPEEWNVLYPERVRAIHQAYVEAGSQIFLTNTFGGTPLRLSSHGLEDRTVELNAAAGKIASQVAEAADREVLVAGSIGPSGQLFEPMGSLTFDKAVEAFREQASGLADGGVDLFWIETMSDLDEVKAAVAGIREISDLPITATMSFDTHGHTMMGVSPARAARELGQLDLVALGANCGTGSDELIETIQAMRAEAPEATLIAKANAGIPKIVGDEVLFNGSPEVMAVYASEVYQAGAQLIGGCCGNTPAHVQAMAGALKQFS
ncbi:MAG TPA: betaine--homocysteine S-methyltransferase [Chloroflexi bacterium]|nr:betaine--homocysteine S-methyltransferase [Chloroflexota bacterium]